MTILLDDIVIELLGCITVEVFDDCDVMIIVSVSLFVGDNVTFSLLDILILGVTLSRSPGFCVLAGCTETLVLFNTELYTLDMPLPLSVVTKKSLENILMISDWKPVITELNSMIDSEEVQ